MPPATRQRAAGQPFTSPSVDFTPLSSIDVETMLTAAEQVSESAPTLRRSTRRATLLAKAAIQSQGKAAVTATQRSAIKSALPTRRSTASTLILPTTKPTTATRSRLPAAANAAIGAATLRSKQPQDKENVGPPQSAGASKQLAMDKRSAAEVRRSSRLTSLPVPAAAVAPIGLSGARQPRKPLQAAANRVSTTPLPEVTAPAPATDDNATEPQTIIVDAAVEPILVVTASKAAAAPPQCSGNMPTPSAVPSLTTASSSPTVALPHTAAVGSSLSTARKLRLGPIQAVQLLSPIRAAPLSARTRTYRQATPTQRRRSASVRRDSLLGDASTLVWQVNTPPTDEVRAIASREEEKRRLKAEKEHKREMEQQRKEEEAENERQRMAVHQQETAVVEAQRRLSLSQPGLQQLEQSSVVPNTPSQQHVLSTQQHSVLDVPIAEEAVVDEQRLQVSCEEVVALADSELHERRPAVCSIRALVGASVSAALLAVIGAVLLCPSEVDAWLS